MACMADRVTAHKELARCIDAIPSVQAVDYLEPDASPSGYPETEIVVRATGTGSVPNAVVCKICQSSLGIVRATAGNAPGYKRVVVR